jgi:hypothetical protein
MTCVFCGDGRMEEKDNASKHWEKMCVVEPLESNMKAKG